MVNEDAGEVEIKSRLTDETFVLCLGPNQIAKIEETLRKPLADVVNDLARMSVTAARVIIRCSYVVPKGVKPLTDSNAGDILNAVGFKPVMEAITKGLKWMSFGIEDETDGTENPPAAAGAASA